MKVDLKDVTFYILIRLDSVERLENILVVSELLSKYFHTNIFIREAGTHNNGVLRKMLSKNISYEFIEDEDPILHKTMHFNQMTANNKTSYLAIWDADIVPEKKAIMDCLERLREAKADVAYPYNGKCLDVPSIIRAYFLKKKNFNLLNTNSKKMDLLHIRILYGGAVFVNSIKYTQAGKENEEHYGWGDDDFDRYYRFRGLGYNIYRTQNCLFHLTHSRGINSDFSSNLSCKISSYVRFKVENSSEIEITRFYTKPVNV